MTRNEKTKFLLYGLFGAINVGDELVCLSVADNLRKNVPDSEISVLTLNREKSARFNGNLGYVNFIEAGAINYKYWPRLFKLIPIVLKHDVIVIGGGGLFQDLYSWRLMSSSLSLAAFGKLFGKKVFVNGVGAGPVNRNWLKHAAKRILKFVDYATVRDERSLRVLQEISEIEKCCITADVVPAYDFPEKVSQTDKKRVAFILRDWPGLNYESVAALMDSLVASGKQLDLYCFNPDSEIVFYDKILKHCVRTTEENCRKVLPNDYESLVNQLAKACVVVSMRLHGCILSAALKKPLIPVIYEQKVRGFAEQVGIVEYLKEVNDITPKLIKTMDFLTEKKISISDSAYEKMKESSKENFRIIAKELTGSGKKLSAANKTSVLFALILLLSHCFIREIPHLSKSVFTRIFK